ncbi:MAG TPA: hemolysin III family protein [Micromonosporaceae bacterium]
MTTTRSPRLRPIDIGKPRMRGWLHTYAFFVALAAGAVLCTLAYTRPGTAPVVSCAVYSLTVCVLFGTSALYHRRVWSPRGYQIMRRLDHSMIFVFIAGTYTPFSVLLLPPRTASVLLAVVWIGALLGVAMKMISPNAPRWIGAPLYVALGWVAVAVLPDLARRAGVTALVLLLVGGAVYTIGAVCYALRRPNPWPATFGHHEFFHAFTLVAALCHQIAVYYALYA